MNLTIRRAACVLTQALVLGAAASSSPIGESKPFDDASAAMPIGEFQPVPEFDTLKFDTQTVAATPPAPTEIVAVAQLLPTAGEPRNVTPGRPDVDTTVSALKALTDQVKSLEARIAAQDARIALLERSLDDLQRKSR
jgi:hypothetical protein